MKKAFSARRDDLIYHIEAWLKEVTYDGHPVEILIEILDDGKMKI